MFDPADRPSLEKYSSAFTLSDMEIFIFPELLYSLVLANIMSPMVWEWRRDPWFEKIDTMSEYRRVLRIKQFIMNRFVFNLDLETWGLTTRERELERFSGFIDEDTLSRSNALFGYEGDRYYFDMDIRRHFGLDRYRSNVIPYWKTETLEAMQAFRYKSGYETGAGECVSLSTLYAAALFVVARIPLEKIHLLATPLHSQNFIDVQDGILTNNRRIVTRKMWFNGTELSAKARRALENEQITMLVNNHGYVHTVYPRATLPPDRYREIRKKLGKYLKTPINHRILGNFLRQYRSMQGCFQIMHRFGGQRRYIESEKVFHYEHGSTFRVGEDSQKKLLGQIDEDEFYPRPIPDRIVMNELGRFFETSPLPVDDSGSLNKLKSYLEGCTADAGRVIRNLVHFCRTVPRFPSADRRYIDQPPILLGACTTRESVIHTLESLRGNHPVADLAMSVFRDMKRCPWKPFMKAALERNPVCLEASRSLDMEGVYRRLKEMEDRSIYDGTRMAQPDEVWNFSRGDGLEKGICMMNILRHRFLGKPVDIEKKGEIVRVTGGNRQYVFTGEKDIPAPVPGDYAFSGAP